MSAEDEHHGTQADAAVPHSPEARSNGESSVARSAAAKWLVFLVVAGVAGVLYWQFGHLLTLSAVAEREASLREWYRQSPLVVTLAAFLVYVVVTGLSLPGAAVLTLAFAWFFGFWRALVLVSFASTTGATVAFLLSRYLLRDTVQRRFSDRLQAFDDALRREGAFYLFTLRLIPAVPFFVINLVMGLTPLRTVTFWWVSQLGMLPGTCVYTWAGSTIPSAGELARTGPGQILSAELVTAFVLLGVFPLAVRKLLRWLRPGTVDAARNSSA